MLSNNHPALDSKGKHDEPLPPTQEGAISQVESQICLHRAARKVSVVGTATAISSFSMVRAEHATPDKSKTYTCSTGTACLEGNASGGSTLGILGISSAIAIEGLTSATNRGFPPSRAFSVRFRRRRLGPLRELFRRPRRLRNLYRECIGGRRGLRAQFVDEQRDGFLRRVG